MKKSWDEKWRKLLTHLEPVDPPQIDQQARERILVMIYDRLTEIAREVLRRVGWIDLEPEDLAGTILVRMIHPTYRTQYRLIQRIVAAKSPESYVFATVRNFALDEARKVMMRRKLSDDYSSIELRCAEPPESASTIETEEEITSVTEGFLRSLGKLRKSDRVLVVRFLAGESTKSLAAEARVSNSTMATRVSRAMARLREMPEMSIWSQVSSQKGFAADIAARIKEFLSNLRREM